MAKRRKSERGFTLLETLVAVGIGGTALAVAVPSMSAALDAHRLTAGLRTTVGAVRAARSVAVTRNAQTRVVVDDTGTAITVQILSGGSWSTVGDAMVLDSNVAVTSVSPSDGLVFSSKGTITAPVRGSGR